MLSASQGARISRDLGQRNLSEIQRRVVDHLAANFEYPARVTALNVGMATRGEIDIDNPRSMLFGFYDQWQVFNTLSAIAWGGKDGNVTWLARYTGDENLRYAVQDHATGGEVYEYRLSEEGFLIYRRSIALTMM